MDRSISGCNDDEIVQGIKTNESRATECLYMLVRKEVFNFVRNNSGSNDDAQDVLQEGVIAVWKNIMTNKYQSDGKTKLSTYSSRVCRFIWYKELRRRNPTFNIPEGYEITDVILESERRDELIEIMLVCLNKMGEKCQGLLRLRFWDGKKLEEIASIFGNTLQVVRNRSSKCTSELYECVKKSRKND